MRVKEYGKLAQNTTIVKIKKNDWHAPDDKSFIIIIFHGPLRYGL